MDVSSHKVSVLPDSEGLWSPRWSHDGRYIAAIASDRRRLMLYDVQARKQSDLAHGEIGFPSWSRDEKFVYFDTQVADAALLRVDIRSRKLERVVSLKNVIRMFGIFGPWIALASDDPILIERDAAASEIHAFDWEAP